MSKKVIVAEHFNNIHQLVNTINSRRNNSVMSSEHCSNTGDYDFTHSHSYKEAINLFENGYVDILPKVVDGMKKMEKKLLTEFKNVRKIYPENKVHGFVPHIPNSILNLPNSMINIDRIPQKQKTIEILYEMGANCGENAKLFVDAGIVLLTAIKVLETSKISVKLTLGFMAGIGDYEYTFSSVDIKDYGQRLDLQKLCFPLAHPSMFRRIGFKWLETVPTLTDSSYAWGYGRSPAECDGEWKEFLSTLNLKDNIKVLRAQDIKKMKFDVKTLINSFNIN